MALRDPVAVYNAANNVEIYLVQDALIAAGIDAFVIEDNSQAGTWALGLIPELHKPQVWIEKADIERARPILIEFERRKNELTGVQNQPTISRSSFLVRTAASAPYPAAQRGSVQQCPHCGGFVDVGEDEDTAEWEAADDSGNSRQDQEKTQKKSACRGSSLRHADVQGSIHLLIYFVG